MEDQRRLLRSVFGDSSDNEDDTNLSESVSSLRTSKAPCWERVKGVNGLWLCSEFLSPESQSRLLSAIESEGWFTEASHNQAMRFGDLPNWAIELAGFIREAVCGSESQWELSDDLNVEDCPLPPRLLWREPLFDQLIVNVYQPGEGICGHVDLLRFDDGIAIVSLESSCVMHFTPVAKEACADERGSPNGESCPIWNIPVLLLPGSLVLMSGEARYFWKHEINRKVGFQVWDGEELEQKKRTSVTLRKLCQVS